MAAGDEQDLIEAVVTCEGNLHDPDFQDRFRTLVNKLKSALYISKTKDPFRVRKIEPWNSVRVTISIPKEAAQKLKLLAQQGSNVLRSMGILSVQVEGDQVISLTWATQNNEATQVILRQTNDDPQSSGTSGISSSSLPASSPSISSISSSIASISSPIPLTPGGPSSSSSSDHPLTSGGALSLGITLDMLSSQSSSSSNSSSSSSSFRSPNVVAPGGESIPVLPPKGIQASGSAGGPGGIRPASLGGPFPFVSMTHAAQAIQRSELSPMLINNNNHQNSNSNFNHHHHQISGSSNAAGNSTNSNVLLQQHPQAPPSRPPHHHPQHPHHQQSHPVTISSGASLNFNSTSTSVNSEQQQQQVVVAQTVTPNNNNNLNINNNSNVALSHAGPSHQSLQQQLQLVNVPPPYPGVNTSISSNHSSLISSANSSSFQQHHQNLVGVAGGARHQHPSQSQLQQQQQQQAALLRNVGVETPSDSFVGVQGQGHPVSSPLLVNLLQNNDTVSGGGSSAPSTQTTEASHNQQQRILLLQHQQQQLKKTKRGLSMDGASSSSPSVPPSLVDASSSPSTSSGGGNVPPKSGDQFQFALPLPSSTDPSPGSSSTVTMNRVMVPQGHGGTGGVSSNEPNSSSSTPPNAALLHPHFQGRTIVQGQIRSIPVQQQQQQVSQAPPPYPSDKQAHQQNLQQHHVTLQNGPINPGGGQGDPSLATVTLVQSSSVGLSLASSSAAGGASVAADQSRTLLPITTVNIVSGSSNLNSNNNNLISATVKDSDSKTFIPPPDPRLSSSQVQKLSTSNANASNSVSARNSSNLIVQQTSSSSVAKSSTSQPLQRPPPLPPSAATMWSRRISAMNAAADSNAKESVGKEAPVRRTFVSGGKPRQFLINPQTGKMEVKGDSGEDSESEEEDDDDEESGSSGSGKGNRLFKSNHKGGKGAYYSSKNTKSGKGGGVMSSFSGSTPPTPTAIPPAPSHIHHQKIVTTETGVTVARVIKTSCSPDANQAQSFGGEILFEGKRGGVNSTDSHLIPQSVMSVSKKTKSEDSGGGGSGPPAASFIASTSTTTAALYTNSPKDSSLSKDTSPGPATVTATSVTGEKIKLRLKLEKSVPISPASKADVSYVKKSEKSSVALPGGGSSQGTSTPSLISSLPSPMAMASSSSISSSSSSYSQSTPGGDQQPRVPPLHISLRGKNAAVVVSPRREEKDMPPPPPSLLSSSVVSTKELLVKDASSDNLQSSSKSLPPILNSHEGKLSGSSTKSGGSTKRTKNREKGFDGNGEKVKVKNSRPKLNKEVTTKSSSTLSLSSSSAVDDDKDPGHLTMPVLQPAVILPTLEQDKMLRDQQRYHHPQQLQAPSPHQIPPSQQQSSNSQGTKASILESKKQNAPGPPQPIPIVGVVEKINTARPVPTPDNNLKSKETLETPLPPPAVSIVASAVVKESIVKVGDAKILQSSSSSTVVAPSVKATGHDLKGGPLAPKEKAGKPLEKSESSSQNDIKEVVKEVTPPKTSAPPPTKEEPVKILETPSTIDMSTSATSVSSVKSEEVTKKATPSPPEDKLPSTSSKRSDPPPLKPIQPLSLSVKPLEAFAPKEEKVVEVPRTKPSPILQDTSKGAFSISSQSSSSPTSTMSTTPVSGGTLTLSAEGKTKSETSGVPVAPPPTKKETSSSTAIITKPDNNPHQEKLKKEEEKSLLSTSTLKNNNAINKKDESVVSPVISLHVSCDITSTNTKTTSMESESGGKDDKSLEGMTKRDDKTGLEDKLISSQKKEEDTTEKKAVVEPPVVDLTSPDKLSSSSTGATTTITPVVEDKNKSKTTGAGVQENKQVIKTTSTSPDIIVGSAAAAARGIEGKRLSFSGPNTVTKMEGKVGGDSEKRKPEIEKRRLESTEMVTVTAASATTAVAAVVNIDNLEDERNTREIGSKKVLPPPRVEKKVEKTIVVADKKKEVETKEPQSNKPLEETATPKKPVEAVSTKKEAESVAVNPISSITTTTEPKKDTGTGGVKRKRSPSPAEEKRDMGNKAVKCTQPVETKIIPPSTVPAVTEKEKSTEVKSQDPRQEEKEEASTVKQFEEVKAAVALPSPIVVDDTKNAPTKSEVNVVKKPMDVAPVEAPAPVLIAPTPDSQKDPKPAPPVSEYSPKEIPPTSTAISNKKEEKKEEIKELIPSKQLTQEVKNVQEIVAKKSKPPPPPTPSLEMNLGVLKATSVKGLQSLFQKKVASATPPVASSVTAVKEGSLDIKELLEKSSKLETKVDDKQKELKKDVPVPSTSDPVSQPQEDLSSSKPLSTTVTKEPEKSAAKAPLTATPVAKSPVVPSASSTLEDQAKKDTPPPQNPLVVPLVESEDKKQAPQEEKITAPAPPQVAPSEKESEKQEKDKPKVTVAPSTQSTNTSLESVKPEVVAKKTPVTQQIIVKPIPVSVNDTNTTTEPPTPIVKLTVNNMLREEPKTEEKITLPPEVDTHDADKNDVEAKVPEKPEEKVEENPPKVVEVELKEKDSTISTPQVVHTNPPQLVPVESSSPPVPKLSVAPTLQAPATDKKSPLLSPPPPMIEKEVEAPFVPVTEGSSQNIMTSSDVSVTIMTPKTETSVSSATSSNAPPPISIVLPSTVSPIPAGGGKDLLGAGSTKNTYKRRAEIKPGALQNTLKRLHDNFLPKVLKTSEQQDALTAGAESTSSEGNVDEVVASPPSTPPIAPPTAVAAAPPPPVVTVNATPVTTTQPKLVTPKPPPQMPILTKSVNLTLPQVRPIPNLIQRPPKLTTATTTTMVGGPPTLHQIPTASLSTVQSNILTAVSTAISSAGLSSVTSLSVASTAPGGQTTQTVFAIHPNVSIPANFAQLQQSPSVVLPGGHKMVPIKLVTLPKQGGGQLQTIPLGGATPNRSSPNLLEAVNIVANAGSRSSSPKTTIQQHAPLNLSSIQGLPVGSNLHFVPISVSSASGTTGNVKVLMTQPIKMQQAGGLGQSMVVKSVLMGNSNQPTTIRVIRPANFQDPISIQNLINKPHHQQSDQATVGGTLVSANKILLNHPNKITQDMLSSTMGSPSIVITGGGGGDSSQIFGGIVGGKAGFTSNSATVTAIQSESLFKKLDGVEIVDTGSPLNNDELGFEADIIHDEKDLEDILAAETEKEETLGGIPAENCTNFRSSSNPPPPILEKQTNSKSRPEATSTPVQNHVGSSRRFLNIPPRNATTTATPPETVTTPDSPAPVMRVSSPHFTYSSSGPSRKSSRERQRSSVSRSPSPFTGPDLHLHGEDEEIINSFSRSPSQPRLSPQITLKPAFESNDVVVNKSGGNGGGSSSTRSDHTYGIQSGSSSSSSSSVDMVNCDNSNSNSIGQELSIEIPPIDMEVVTTLSPASTSSSSANHNNNPHQQTEGKRCTRSTRSNPRLSPDITAFVSSETASSGGGSSTSKPNKLVQQTQKVELMALRSSPKPSPTGSLKVLSPTPSSLTITPSTSTRSSPILHNQHQINASNAAATINAVAMGIIDKIQGNATAQNVKNSRISKLTGGSSGGNKRKRQESDSSSASRDGETTEGGDKTEIDLNSRPGKRKCSENAAEMIKVCIGVEDSPKRNSGSGGSVGGGNSKKTEGETKEVTGRSKDSKGKKTMTPLLEEDDDVDSEVSVPRSGRSGRSSRESSEDRSSSRGSSAQRSTVSVTERSKGRDEDSTPSSKETKSSRLNSRMIKEAAAAASAKSKSVMLQNSERSNLNSAASTTPGGKKAKSDSKTATPRRTTSNASTASSGGANPKKTPNSKNKSAALPSQKASPAKTRTKVRKAVGSTGSKDGGVGGTTTTSGSSGHPEKNATSGSINATSSEASGGVAGGGASNAHNSANQDGAENARRKTRSSAAGKRHVT